MRALLPRIKPVLQYINERHPLNQRVPLETVYAGICSTGLVDSVDRLTCDFNSAKLQAVFSGFAPAADGQRIALILHRPYDEVDPLADPNYPSIRFHMAKEMIHVFDTEAEKTRPHQAVVDLMTQLVARDRTGMTDDHWIDQRAIAGAVELLVRYEVRCAMIGGFMISRARATGDFSEIAEAFLVPGWVAKLAFDEKYHDLIGQLRGDARMLPYEW